MQAGGTVRFFLYWQAQDAFYGCKFRPYANGDRFSHAEPKEPPALQKAGDFVLWLASVVVPASRPVAGMHDFPGPYSLAGCRRAWPTMLSSSTIPKGFGRKFSPAFSSFALLKVVGE